MKTRLPLIRCGLLLLLGYNALAHGQMEGGMGRPEGGRPHNPYGRELLAYRAYEFADVTDRSKTIVEFHVALVNDVLSFVKMSDRWYRARYELNIVFYNKKKEVVSFQSARDTVSVQDFHSTNSRRGPIYHKFVFTLAPDDYQYKIELQDLDAPKNMDRLIPLKVMDFTKPSLQISDVVLADRLSCSSGLLHDFTPNLRETFTGDTSEVGAYFEVYSAPSPDSLTVRYAPFAGNGEGIAEKSFRMAAEARTAQCLTLKPWIKKPGEYRLVITVQSGKVQVRAERKFYIQWGQMPLQSGNIDVAIEQLALVAPGGAVSRMRSAAAEERQALFDRFWQERDPTPGTERNELRDEFFSRIDFANNNFSEMISGQEGWRSDRGRVLMRNGTPDNVERQAAEIGMPAVEIWVYTRLAKKYIFVDRQGSGEFRLVKVE